jgi:DNA polymerase-3 subunit chi
MTKIYFTTTKTPKEKVIFLTKTAHHFFHKKKRLILFTHDFKTAEYVDNLLWSDPQESFLPHYLSRTVIDEQIVITHENTNLNHALAAFNLTTAPLDCRLLKLQEVFEIEDLTSKERAEQFKKKLQIYKNNGYAVVALK